MSKNSRFAKDMTVAWFLSLAAVIFLLAVQQVDWDLNRSIPEWTLPVALAVFLLLSLFQGVRAFGGSHHGYNVKEMTLPLLEDSGPLIVGPPVESIINFRGVGGLHTADGGSVKPNLLFRSAAWDTLSTPDLSIITEEIGMKTVVDLRSAKERAVRRDVEPTGVQNFHMPLSIVGGLSGAVRFGCFALCARNRLPGFMENMYITLLSSRPTVWAEWIQLVSDPRNLPVTVHCTAGKDRTGLAVALVLALCGVPEETIVREFSKSNEDFPRLMKLYSEGYPLRFLGVPDEDMTPLLASNPEHLRAAFAYLHQNHGGPVNYLLTAGGLKQTTLDRVKENFVTLPV